METPLFTVVTVTYNAEHTIERTVESVAGQTFADYEHLIIDGASTDRTLALVENCLPAGRVTVVSEPDKGLYDAMNKAIGMAAGKYLVFLNAGDKFHSSETLRTIADAIAGNNFPDIVYGQTNLVDDAGAFIAPRHLTAPESLTAADFARGMLVCHQSFIVKREIAPTYSLDYRYSADYDWCIKCLKKSKKNVYADAVLTDYLYEGLSTTNRRKSLAERFKIMSENYGFLPTCIRHLGFVFRFLRHQSKLKGAVNNNLADK